MNSVLYACLEVARTLHQLLRGYDYRWPLRAMSVSAYVVVWRDAITSQVLGGLMMRLLYTSFFGLGFHLLVLSLFSVG
jgi:hypothetical protein